MEIVFCLSLSLSCLHLCCCLFLRSCTFNSGGLNEGYIFSLWQADDAPMTQRALILLCMTHVCERACHTNVAYPPFRSPLLRSAWTDPLCRDDHPFALAYVWMRSWYSSVGPTGASTSSGLLSPRGAERQSTPTAVAKGAMDRAQCAMWSSEGVNIYNMCQTLVYWCHSTWQAALVKRLVVVVDVWALRWPGSLKRHFWFL